MIINLWLAANFIMMQCHGNAATGHEMGELV